MSRFLVMPGPGRPDWSHDGTKILFDSSIEMWTRSRLMTVERRDGRPKLKDLGPGLCGKFSPDDRRIAFALHPGDASDQAGIWIMNADGTAGAGSSLTSTGPRSGPTTGGSS